MSLRRMALFIGRVTEASSAPVTVTYPFSINETQQVLFSPGNLQYQASTGMWRFAEHQWDFVGNEESGNVYEGEEKCSNTLTSDSYNGWIDLFGWGTSGWDNGNTYYQPYNISRTNNSAVGYGYGPTDGDSYYFNLTGSYDHADWGMNNPIYNPQSHDLDTEGRWYTLTQEEWTYIISGRSTDSGMYYVRATVNDVPGVLLFPDNWDPDIYNFESINTSAYYTANIIDLNNWEQILEPSGAVFLPAAGMRVYNTQVNNVGTTGVYWSSTADQDDSGKAFSARFGANKDKINPNNTGGNKAYGYSVCLVKLINE